MSVVQSNTTITESTNYAEADNNEIRREAESRPIKQSKKQSGKAVSLSTENPTYMMCTIPYANKTELPP